MSASLWQAPLGEFQQRVAAPRPAPAGVATASVSAALGLSLLVKVLRITGKRPELLDPAIRLTEELRAAADADVAAVHAYMERRETQGLHEVPARAAHAVSQALALCVQAEPSISGLIAADVRAAAALLEGAAAAISACIEANESH